jgi:Protein of unknown function (DUF3185)
MRTLLSVLAIIAGVWLLHMGYVRQQSLAGKTDNTISKIGQSIDGEDHPTTQGRYYVAGAILLLGGLVGLGTGKKSAP